MLVDTVAGLVRLEALPDPALFDGAAVSADFGSGERNERLWRNGRGDGYEPRVTFWPGSMALRVEFSVKKLGGDLDAAMLWVDEWLSVWLGVRVPPVVTWRCQRVDYCADVYVGADAGAYLAAAGGLPGGRFVRVAFAGEGVVFKSGSRWVKVYDKSRESGRGAGVLRFEVSNFRDAVRYMAERWFVCDRSVGEMVRPGRALYVLAYYLGRLGFLGSGFGARERLVYALRERYGGRSLAGALHAHDCITAYGAEAWRSLGLISRSSFYRWLSALRADGLLAVVEGSAGLPAIALPAESVFSVICGSANLKNFSTGGNRGLEKKPGGKFGENGSLWDVLAGELGINRDCEPVSWLTAAFERWLERDGRGVDAAFA